MIDGKSTENVSNRMTRLEFLRTGMRWLFFLAALCFGSDLFKRAWKKDNTCSGSKGYCPGCARSRICGLPAALSFRKVKKTAFAKDRNAGKINGT